MGDVPDMELANILQERCALAPSYAAKLVAVMRELQRRRQVSSTVLHSSCSPLMTCQSELARPCSTLYMLMFAHHVLCDLILSWQDAAGCGRTCHIGGILMLHVGSCTANSVSLRDSRSHVLDTDGVL